MKQFWYLVPLFLAHATCSVSMVLLNKTIAQGFDFPWTVLFIQNVGTVLIGYLHPCLCGSKSKVKDDSKKAEEDVEDPKTKVQLRICGMKVPRKTKNRLLVALQTAFFMATLFLSLKALRFISVPLYVVARNTVPAQTALLERVFTSVRLSVSAITGLMFTIFGAILYTYGDLQAGLQVGGLAYAMMLTLIVSGCSIIDKTSVRRLGQEEDIKPVEVNQMRVALALPVNLLFIAAFDAGHSSAAGAGDEKPELYAALSGMPYAVKLSLLLSTLFGFGMGTFNFYLQQSVSAATVQVANILYKLCTTIISLVTHPAPVAKISWMGYAVSLLGIALYTFAPGLACGP
eukprot:CAMPEP_0171225068 /NCGR_PEP_ID=MMETSP0790-20130122/36615_1 /TAXON_ID=2925 /ORGANISM="Alexandrium catenella, Strain OF101" /LENGTH=344 /DNA_ID=CAMNT_0011691087 /DNA_START=31 /DNA_END=1062 /DNA_ORIENTATION=+